MGVVSAEVPPNVAEHFALVAQNLLEILENRVRLESRNILG
jgi:hypothetical protein